MPGVGTQKIHATSPFTSCGTPIAAASATPGWPTAADSSSAGPDALAGDVQRVVGAPVQEPVAVLVDRCPIAVRPDPRKASPVRFEVALRIAPEPARHARERLRQTSSPTSSRTELPSASTTSIAIPSAGPPREHALIGIADRRRQEAGAHLGSARAVDDRADSRGPKRDRLLRSYPWLAGTDERKPTRFETEDPGRAL